MGQISSITDWLEVECRKHDSFCQIVERDLDSEMAIIAEAHWTALSVRDAAHVLRQYYCLLFCLIALAHGDCVTYRDDLVDLATR